ncbi:hypothetical protein [Hyphomicrobium sp. 99]|uniref:hypothetical protein n=1 Tax=Hyphomicrobium sp. 99 TaxID=1163419 RepID=UPI001FD9DC95|nr:hypothetical protein [Hyphomicrobium sp. 99]
MSIAISAFLGSAAGNASELCVKCSGPDASYACVINGTSSATIDTVGKLYCITALAKSGAHSSCSIDRAMTAPCPGERKELPVPAVLDDGGSEDQPQHGAPDLTKAGEGPSATEPLEAPSPAMQVEPAGTPPDQPKDAVTNEPPPKTVQEMVEKSAKTAGTGLSDTQKSAGEAAKSASTALGKAGAAVSGAAKSSWKCLSSFFSNC